MEHNFKDAEYWIKTWEKAWQKSLHGGLQHRCTDYWNRRAVRFAAMAAGNKHRQQILELMQWMEKHQAKTSDLRILDIGCGPGAYSLLLAERANKITALDPASEMLKFLNQNARRQEINNIETVEARWQDVNLNQRGWEKAFDLVIAIKSPGINSAAALEKMNDACRGCCMIIDIMDQHRPELEEIWYNIKGSPMPVLQPEAFIIQHILYAQGYLPTLEIKQTKTRRLYQPEEAAEVLLDFLYPHMELTDNITAIVKNYVHRSLHQGEFFFNMDRIEGVLYWDTEKINY